MTFSVQEELQCHDTRVCLRVSHLSLNQVVALCADMFEKI